MGHTVLGWTEGEKQILRLLHPSQQVRWPGTPVRRRMTRGRVYVPLIAVRLR